MPSDDGDVAMSPDQAAAERLLARNARSLARVADPRQRRQRAYALLARNGFDPDICRSVGRVGRHGGSRGHPRRGASGQSRCQPGSRPGRRRVAGGSTFG